MKSILLLIFCISPIWTLPSSRIIGGQPAIVGEFPFAAAIYKTTSDGNYFCSGGLLNEQWVITAGQCVDGATLFRILLGLIKLNASDESVQQLATDQYVLHPGYNPLTLEHDIGLIKFRLPITFSTYINRLYLPYSPMSDGHVVQAYGWGQLSDNDPNISNDLNWVSLTHIPDDECKIIYGNQLFETMSCYGGNYNEGTCYGDTGSPVTMYISRAYTVILAVGSFISGNGCESTDPSGYTEVFPYNDWVNNVTAEINN